MASPEPAAVPFSAGIIAAGDGTRLQAAFPGVLKPLLPVGGRPLIEWTASGLVAAGAREIVVLLNSRGRPVRELLKARLPGTRWVFLEADTASSWESFRLVARTLAERAERFWISTVDALIPAGEIRRFVRDCAPPSLAVTRFVEDEKPLWAELGPDGRISAIGPRCRRRELVTCGLYAMTRTLARELEGPAAFSSLREFWGSVAESAAGVGGLELGSTVDVDRPEDLPAAERLLSEAGR